jgi:hypothetical protein
MTFQNNTPTLEEVLCRYVLIQQSDIEFLQRCGWKKCEGEVTELPKTKGLKCNSIWKHPERDEKYPQIAKIPGGNIKVRTAIEVAEDDYLKELEWKEVRVRIHHNTSINSKEESWYIHPETKRIYNHRDAKKIARDSYNDEQVMCLLTNRLNELVDGNRLQAGDLLVFDCTNGVYELWV